MFVLSTDDGSAIRSASKVTVCHAFGDGNIRWRGKLYSVSGKQELSVSDTPVVPVKPSAPAGSGASGTKEPAVLPFTDVAKQDWFYGDVAYVYENSLMNGVSKTTFAPGQKTTRAMIVTILWRLEGSPAAKKHPDSMMSQQAYTMQMLWHGQRKTTSSMAAAADGLHRMTRLQESSSQQFCTATAAIAAKAPL